MRQVPSRTQLVLTAAAVFMFAVLVLLHYLTP